MYIYKGGQKVSVSYTAYNGFAQIYISTALKQQLHNPLSIVPSSPHKYSKGAWCTSVNIEAAIQQNSDQVGVSFLARTNEQAVTNLQVPVACIISARNDSSTLMVR